MIVHPKRRPRPQVQPPLTALIDLVFLLLIYFLLTSNFLNEQGIAVRLPAARAAAQPRPEAVLVTVDRQGRFFVNGKETAADGLDSRLCHLLAGRRERAVVVRADRSVAVDRVVTALDAARAAGAQRLSLATEMKP